MCRRYLDAHRPGRQRRQRFANDKGSAKRLSNGSRRRLYAGSCSNRPGYHRAVERALGIAGVPFVAVNPRRARRSRSIRGKLAKTDRLDAAILARMGAMLEPEARPAGSELLLELKELYVAREALVKDRTAAKNRGKALTLAAEASECSAASNRSIARSRRSKQSSRLSKPTQASPIASPS